MLGLQCMISEENHFRLTKYTQDFALKQSILCPTLCLSSINLSYKQNHFLQITAHMSLTVFENEAASH